MGNDKQLTVEERIDMAMEGRRKGFNCAQAVVTAFPDVLHLPMDVALRLSCGFGSGYGGMQKMCGVMSAMTLLEGIRYENATMQKAGVYKVIRNLGNDFKEAVGSLECKEIKEADHAIPCN